MASHLWLLESGRLSFDGELDELKESIVRLHLIHPLKIADSLALTTSRVVRTDLSAERETWIIRGWNDELAAECAAAITSAYHVESLGLEDAFVEISQ